MKAVGFIITSFFLSFADQAIAINEFAETFDGNGPFETIDGKFSGLDNPNWQIFGNGELRDGGYFVSVDPQGETSFLTDTINRENLGDGSFKHRVEIRDLETSVPGENFEDMVIVFLEHQLDQKGASFLLLQLSSRKDNRLTLGIRAGSQPVIVTDLIPGPNMAIEILYDDELSKATFSFDNNVDDDIDPLTFVENYVDTIGTIQRARLQFGAAWYASINGIVDFWSFTDPNASSFGDFNDNRLLDIEDIDLLSAEVRAMTHNLDFNLNADNTVDEFDRNIWVHDLRDTYFGDSNLDGEFNSADLVEVFQANEYEDDIEGNSTWATGDWNGDGDFTSRDLVVAFADGGYEMGPRAAVRSVPEPSGVLLVFSMICLIQTAKKSSRRVAKDTR